MSEYNQFFFKIIDYLSAMKHKH